MAGGGWMNNCWNERAWVMVTKIEVNDPATEKRKIIVRRHFRHDCPARSA